jgi:hypothetical protein
MPLKDGSLAPGMLTVRIVRGAFAGNLAGQTVHLDVTGGRVETQTTGDDGRASFAHLPVGGQVRASATVEGQALTSETITMPADSGVRVLLVLEGEGSPSPATGTQTAASTVSTSAPSSLPNPRRIEASPVPAADTGATIGRVVLLVATLGGLALVLSRRRSPARHRPSEDGADA